MLRATGYLVFEYFTSVAIVFVIATFLFGVSLVILISQEEAKRLATGLNRLAERAKDATVQFQSHKLPSQSPQRIR